jgi:hypothetical protein
MWPRRVFFMALWVLVYVVDVVLFVSNRFPSMVTLLLSAVLKSSILFVLGMVGLVLFTAFRFNDMYGWMDVLLSHCFAGDWITRHQTQLQTEQQHHHPWLKLVTRQARLYEDIWPHLAAHCWEQSCFNTTSVG